MKQLIYRDIVGNNPRKHEVSIEEICDQTENTITKKWIRKYFLKEKYSSSNLQNLKKWIAMKQETECRRDCHVLRKIDTQTGESKIVCKVLGDIFIVHENTVYRIVYVNELKIQS